LTLFLCHPIFCVLCDPMICAGRDLRARAVPLPSAISQPPISHADSTAKPSPRAFCTTRTAARWRRRRSAGWSGPRLIPSLIRLRPEPVGTHHREPAIQVADPVDRRRTQPRRLGKRVGRDGCAQAVDASSKPTEAVQHQSAATGQTKADLQRSDLTF
jgi:hypothetical protein